MTLCSLVYVLFYFQRVIVDSMDMAASLFVSVIKVTPFHVTLLMGGATVTRDGLGKSALCVRKYVIIKYLSKLIKAGK